MLWRTIAGYEGYYEVSTDGQVRSLNRTVRSRSGRTKRLKGQQMKLTYSKSSGYMVVNLRKFGASEVIPVHILVATMFLPNPYDYPMVNHKDGNKTNNHVENLEWATYSHNNIHALENNLRKPRGIPVMQCTLDGYLIEVYDSVFQAARETDISAGSISQCINHHTYTAGGFVWIKLSEGLTTIL